VICVYKDKYLRAQTYTVNYNWIIQDDYSFCEAVRNKKVSKCMRTVRILGCSLGFVSLSQKPEIRKNWVQNASHSCLQLLFETFFSLINVQQVML
jgi:hypothetical protein